MKKAQMILRIFYGLFLLFFGLNGFLQFMPWPELSEKATMFIGAVASTGVLFPIIGLVEIIAGTLLVINRGIPFALLVVFPIIFLATIFHLTLDTEGLINPLIGLVVHLVLFYLYREKFMPLFTSKGR